MPRCSLASLGCRKDVHSSVAKTATNRLRRLDYHQTDHYDHLGFTTSSRLLKIMNIMHFRALGLRGFWGRRVLGKGKENEWDNAVGLKVATHSGVTFKVTSHASRKPLEQCSEAIKCLEP